MITLPNPRLTYLAADLAWMLRCLPNILNLSVSQNELVIHSSFFQLHNPVPFISGRYVLYAPLCDLNCPTRKPKGTLDILLSHLIIKPSPGCVDYHFHSLELSLSASHPPQFPSPSSPTQMAALIHSQPNI